MGIYADRWRAVLSEEDIGGLAPDARECDELLYFVWDFSFAPFDKLTAGADDIFRFVAKKIDGADNLSDFGFARTREVCGGWVRAEEPFPYPKSGLVARARGEDNRDKRFPFRIPPFRREAHMSDIFLQCR